MTYYQNPYVGYYPMQQPMVYPQQQQQPQLFDQQMQPNLPSVDSQSNSHFIWVQGEAGAKSYPVTRGTTLPLFDSEGDFVYFKSVDCNGVPLPLVVKVLSDPPIEAESAQLQVDMSDYVTRESYDVLAKKYTDLESRILDLETKPSSTSTSLTYK